MRISQCRVNFSPTRTVETRQNSPLRELSVLLFVLCRLPLISFNSDIEAYRADRQEEREQKREQRIVPRELLRLLCNSRSIASQTSSVRNRYLASDI